MKAGASRHVAAAIAAALLRTLAGLGDPVEHALQGGELQQCMSKCAGDKQKSAKKSGQSGAKQGVVMAQVAHIMLKAERVVSLPHSTQDCTCLCAPFER